MTAEDLIELLEERPFKPLRLRLDDGRSYEIRHPEMAIVTPTIIAVGVPRTEGTRLAQRVTNCSINHIVEVEPVESAGSR
jgi:hypothetical protein